MDDKDFEELLKKSIDALEKKEANEDLSENGDTDGDNALPEDFEYLMNIMKVGGVVELAKVAQKKMDDIVGELVYALCHGKKDPIEYRSMAYVRIQKAAKKLNVLHTIITMASLYGSATVAEKMNVDNSRLLDLIVKMCIL